MTSVLSIVGASTVIVLVVIAGWRRSAAKAASYREQLHAEIDLAEQLKAQIEVLARDPPEWDEQRRMLERLRAKRRSNVS